MKVGMKSNLHKLEEKVISQSCLSKHVTIIDETIPKWPANTFQLPNQCAHSVSCPPVLYDSQMEWAVQVNWYFQQLLPSPIASDDDIFISLRNLFCKIRSADCLFQAYSNCMYTKNIKKEPELTLSYHYY